MADTPQNPAWPIAAVFDDLGTPNVDLNQAVTLAPSISTNIRDALLLALIVGGTLWIVSRKD